MKRLLAVVCLGLLSLALAASSGVSGDKEKKGEGKFKGMLPAGWKALKLDASQKEKIYEVQRMYRGKIEALEEQIAELKAQEKAAMFKMLTEDQRALLRKVLTGDDGKEKTVKDADKKVGKGEVKEK